jgi:hypothetical protein
MGMTVKTMNRSHRTVFFVILLVFAVGLTTALVLAGERKAQGNSSSTPQTDTVPYISSVWLSGTSNV